MICRLIGSPSPVPTGGWSGAVAALTELLEDGLLVLVGDAGSVVADVDPDRVLAGSTTIRTRPVTGGQNFTAFESRLSITCTTRSRSARTTGAGSGSSTSRGNAAFAEELRGGLRSTS